MAWVPDLDHRHSIESRDAGARNALGRPEPRSSGAFTAMAAPFCWFFPLAALFSAASVLLWLAGLSGMRPLLLHPTLWHGHEMLFGFAAAVIAGFVLTAVANWTGRPAVGRGALAGLVVLWLVGRVAVAAQGTLHWPWLLLAAVEGLFLPCLALVMSRVLIQSRNTRNLMFIPFLWGLALLNLGFHALLAAGEIDAARQLLTLTGWLVGFLLVFMGGRVIPFFSGRRCGYTPRQWPWLNWTSTLAALAAGIALTFAPSSALAAALAGLAAIVTALRLAGWQSPRVWAEPMLWILHLGYAWLVVAYTLAAVVHADLLPWPPTAPLHALLTGALGCLALGMMTRVALGHSGRTITASLLMLIAFVLVVGAGLARLASYADWAGGGLIGLTISASLWALAFTLYALEFITRLWRPERRSPFKGGTHVTHPVS